MSKSTGTVKWFNDVKGYGFIETESGSDAMVYYRNIISDQEFKTLKDGQRVEFIQTVTDRGLQAHEVVPISPD